MDAGLAVQDFLQYLVDGLMPRPEEVRIEHQEIEGVHHFRILVPHGESLRLVGKGGKTYAAISGLVDASAEKHGIRARVEVVEA